MFVNESDSRFETSINYANVSFFVTIIYSFLFHQFLSTSFANYVYFLSINIHLLQTYACTYLYTLTKRAILLYSMIIIFYFLVGIYIAPTQYKSYGDIPNLPVEEDFRCSSVHYYFQAETGT
jgi:hypothetical protein